MCHLLHETTCTVVPRGVRERGVGLADVVVLVQDGIGQGVGVGDGEEVGGDLVVHANVVDISTDVELTKTHLVLRNK